MSRRTPITEAREAKGLSVEKAAVAFGTTSKTWRKYELAPERMPIEMGERIAEFLDIDFDDLVPSKVGQ